jgi:uncharacterized C2H2 Zn-finger protein
MATALRPPIREVPLMLRCPRCGQVFRAKGSFLEARVVACAWCQAPVRLVPRVSEAVS